MKKFFKYFRFFTALEMYMLIYTANSAVCPNYNHTIMYTGVIPFEDVIGVNNSHKVKLVASRLSDNPSLAHWLMMLMWHESGLNPAATNSIGATGLIQFMPNTAINLGTTTHKLRKMSFVEQMDYVYQYFYDYRDHISTLDALCLACFYPYALDKADSYIIGSEVSNSYARTILQQNPIFTDLNRDGVLSKGEFKSYIYNKLVPAVKSAQQK